MRIISKFQGFGRLFGVAHTDSSKNGHDPLIRAKILGLFGGLLIRKGEIEPAIDKFRERLDILEDEKAWDDLVCTLHDIGHAFRLLNNPGRASEQYRKALALSRQHGLKHRIGEGLSHIAMVFFFQKEMEQAQEYFHAAISELKETGDSPLLGRTLMHLANVHRKDGNEKKAEQYYNEAAKVLRSVGDEYNLGIALANQGLLWIAQEEEEKGRAFVTEAFERLSYAGGQPEIQLFKATLSAIYGIEIQA